MKVMKMKNNKLAWHDPAHSNKSTIGTCSVCDFAPNEHGLGELVAVGIRPDSKHPVLVHRGHIGTPMAPIENIMNGYRPELTLTASKEEPENIWAFASKFRYVTAAQTPDTTTSTITDPAQGGQNKNVSIIQTFPTVAETEPDKAIQTNTTQKTNDHGSPMPPKPFE